MSQEEVFTCSREDLEKLSKAKENPNGVLFVFTQQNCGHCEPFMEAAEQAAGEKVSVFEAGLEDKDCNNLAKELNVPGSPIAVLWKDGKEVARIDPSGKTWDVVRNDIASMIKLAEGKETGSGQGISESSSSSP